MKFVFLPEEREAICGMLYAIARGLKTSKLRDVMMNLGSRFRGTGTYVPMSVAEGQLLLDIIAATLSRAQELEKTGEHIENLNLAQATIVSRIAEVQAEGANDSA